MNNVLHSKEKTVQEISEINSGFEEFIKVNPYPNLPYNTITEGFEFKQIFELGNTSPDVAFNRILEWVAINFGNIGEVLHYSSPSDGKIIVKGQLNLLNLTDVKNFWGTLKESAEITTGKFTLAITIKEDKVKLEFLNFKYNRSYYDIILNTYITSTYFTSAESLFPITRFPKESWKRNLSLIQATDTEVIFLTKSISNYVLGKDEDYRF